MDPELQELKREVEQLKAMSQDTNRVLHGMRRSQRWHTFFQIAWWLTVLGISGYAYLTYVQPYVEQAMAAYGNAKDFQLQVQDWFAQFGRSGQ